jgi:hypothetical protein
MAIKTFLIPGGGTYVDLGVGDTVIIPSVGLFSGIDSSISGILDATEASDTAALDVDVYIQLDLAITEAQDVAAFDAQLDIAAIERSDYHGLIKKYVVLFGTLFNNITINRSDGISETQQSMKVPLAYGQKEKFLARAEALVDDSEPKAISLPRIGFELSQITYAPLRKLGTTRKIYSVENVSGTNVNKAVWNPVPYDMYFELFVLSKSIEDGTKIIEQILPYFTPEWTVTAKILDNFPDYSIDLPIILQSVTVEDNYDADFTSGRLLIWTIGFMMKTYAFGPVREPKIIKLANVNIIDDINTV